MAEIACAQIAGRPNKTAKRTKASTKVAFGLRSFANHRDAPARRGDNNIAGLDPPLFTYQARRNMDKVFKPKRPILNVVCSQHRDRVLERKIARVIFAIGHSTDELPCLQQR
jgi:hypothetical protein